MSDIKVTHKVGTISELEDMWFAVHIHSESISFLCIADV